jgi:hypothetical protein
MDHREESMESDVCSALTFENVNEDEPAGVDR